MGLPSWISRLLRPARAEARPFLAADFDRQDRLRELTELGEAADAGSLVRAVRAIEDAVTGVGQGNAPAAGANVVGREVAASCVRRMSRDGHVVSAAHDEQRDGRETDDGDPARFQNCCAHDLAP